MKRADCQHTDQIKSDVQRQTAGCAECLRNGTTKWPAIRLCLTCGHVGCCDSAIDHHARAHFAETGHPLIASNGDPQDSRPPWQWCYIDNDYLES
jgi:uncharacterized UBP type Zn finger protein